MDFQLVVDRQGAAVFPVDTPLQYDADDKVFFDTDCRKRGTDTLFELVCDLLPRPQAGRSMVHSRRIIHITIEDPTETYVPDPVVSDTRGLV